MNDERASYAHTAFIVFGVIAACGAVVFALGGEWTLGMACLVMFFLAAAGASRYR